MQTPVTTVACSIRRTWLARAAGALLAIGGIAALPAPAQAAVYLSVNIAPPILPVYEQPMLPGPGYLWTPGYWAWSGNDYYWVPGSWVLPPFVGGLWTPGYWGWGGGVYIFHRGYWGRHVGFYGGINYGYGYSGHGYEGGYWRGGGFYYNRSVNRVGVNVRNVYNRTVINNNTTIINNRRTSFNGGPRGIAARATPQQAAWGREQHAAPVAAQLRQRDMASRVPSLRASVNHGAPPIAATQRAGTFNDHGIVAARGAPTAMSAAAVREANGAPRAITMRNGDGMRSAGFAPHGEQSMRPTSASRYQPSPQQRDYARPDPNHASQRGEPQVARGAAYQPQDARAARYQPQAYRPATNDPRGNYRPPNARPAATHAAPSRGHAEPAKNPRRDEDQHHR
ncbi:MAG: hypothetical protein ABI389_15675 [Rhodanobacter sp.]